MAPSEESILSNFLLSPASLPTIITLQKFTELFPKRLQSHPQIKVLYRELQELRSQDMDLVSENISKEVKRGAKQRADLLEASKSSGVDGMNDDSHREMDLDLQFFGQASHDPSAEFHAFPSLLSEMERACATLEREISAAEQDATATLAELRKIVGEMSDLRYGKLNKPGITPEDFVAETIRGLKSLEDACDHANTS
jgi:centromere-localized protein 2